MSEKVRLTDQYIKDLKPATAGESYRVHDTELAGFLVVVTATTKTFSIRVKVGNTSKFLKVCSAADKSAREARVMARDLAAEERKKIKQLSAAPAITLPSVWPHFRKRLDHPWKRRKGPASSKTIEQYTDVYERLLKSFHETPLEHLSRNPLIMSAHHVRVTEENGPYIANRMATILDMIYEYASAAHPGMLPPGLPCALVNRNQEERRQTGLTRADMPTWWHQLNANITGVRREFHLFTLLSGLRPSSLCPAKWEHLRLEDRALWVYAKGGESFWVPLSNEMIVCLERARILGKKYFPKHADTYIFPCDSRTGYMVKPKEKRRHLSHYGDDLRQTFATMAELIKDPPIPERHIKMLMNHTIPGEKRRTKPSPGDVTRGYSNDIEFQPELRVSQQRISTFIMEHLTKPLVD